MHTQVLRVMMLSQADHQGIPELIRGHVLGHPVITQVGVKLFLHQVSQPITTGQTESLYVASDIEREANRLWDSSANMCLFFIIIPLISHHSGNTPGGLTGRGLAGALLGWVRAFACHVASLVAVVTFDGGAKDSGLRCSSC
jgi:hypothetical protein